MPWKGSLMDQRRDLVIEVTEGQLSVAAAADKYGVSRKTVHKWLARYAAAGFDGLADQSRRPHNSPRRIDKKVVKRILSLRSSHEDWGCKKIRARLNLEATPCERTVHRVLKRNGRVVAAEPVKPPQSFERSSHNQLWQLDFRSPLYLHTQPSHTRIVPLSVLDDHSRFVVGLRLMPDQQLETLWPVLWKIFGSYGLPDSILTDNANGLFASHRNGVTSFTARLWRLGIEHIRGRPYHPQTQGKVERWHRTLKQGAVKGCCYETLQEAQKAFDEFRKCYNHYRPHESLGQRPPRDFYQPSSRQRPARLPQMLYDDDATLRCVDNKGAINLRGARVRVGEGLIGERVQIINQDPEVLILYGTFKVRRLLWDDLIRGNWT